MASDSQEDPESMGPPTTQRFQHAVLGAKHTGGSDIVLAFISQRHAA